MGNETESITVDLGGNKIFRLHFQQWEEDINIDELTQIDYTNIYAELITIPSLLNRVGIWKAQAENAFSRSKMDSDIEEAKESESQRLKLKRTEGVKVKWPTVKEIENAVTLSEEVQKSKKKVIRRRKDADYIDALYWSVKDKAKKLDRISNNMSLSPEDFEKELISGSINGILIKAYKKKYGVTK